jgi:hypothetical protein
VRQRSCPAPDRIHRCRRSRLTLQVRRMNERRNRVHCERVCDVFAERTDTAAGTARNYRLPRFTAWASVRSSPRATGMP